MIHTQGLTRHFRVKGETVEAVRGIDIDVAPGELVAFLGPNGAGKTTAFRMLTTLLAPTQGAATVAGHDVIRDPRAVRGKIGYVGQGTGVANDQHAIDELVTQGRCYGLTRAESRSRAAELLDTLELTGAAKRNADSLSGGQRRRLDVALGLMHHPPLLFLDEPSTGLDPHSRANLWEHIARLHRENNTTVFLTTHYLDEADTVADRIIVIDHGRIIAEGTPDELKSKVSGDLITVGTPSEEMARKAATVAERVPTAHEVESSETGMRMRVDRGDALLPELLKALADASVELSTVRVQRPTLDDVFLTLTGRSLRDSDTPESES